MRHRWWGAVAVAALVLGACSSGSDSSESTENPPGSGAAATAAGADPAYAEPGPYAVGITTLSLPDRKVEVYYPARRGSTDGEPRATYTQTDPIPPEILAGLPAVPAGVDLTVELPATRDVAVATDGPFPLVIFSHGAGGWRGVYAHPLSGIASWGFVVASIDFEEYGLLAQFSGGGADDATAAGAIKDAATGTIDLLAAESDTPDSRFHDAVATKQVGAVGHSAGGSTMFGLLGDPRIGAIVGWAPGGPDEPVTANPPTMVIGGEDDIAVTPESALRTYESLLAPKRLVEIGDLGHNAFSDACLAIRGGTDLIGIAKQLGIGIPDRLLDLGRNGCEPGALDTKQGWRIIQHFTVAELRNALGVDEVPVGLGPGIADAFPGVTITYRQDVR